MGEESLENKRWQNRRKLAFAAFKFAVLYAFCVLGFFYFASPETVNAAKEVGAVSIATMGFFGGIVMAYIGGASYVDGKKND